MRIRNAARVDRRTELNHFVIGSHKGAGNMMTVKKGFLFIYGHYNNLFIYLYILKTYSFFIEVK